MKFVLVVLFLTASMEIDAFDIQAVSKKCDSLEKKVATLEAQNEVNPDVVIGVWLEVNQLANSILQVEVENSDLDALPQQVKNQLGTLIQKSKSFFMRMEEIEKKPIRQKRRELRARAFSFTF